MAARLSLSQARRIALHSQSLAKVRPTQPVTARVVGRTFAQLQLVQIDSVNVLSRSHFLPFFSRLGDYDRELLAGLAGKSPRKMVEYWAHEASFVRPEHFYDLTVWQNRRWVGSSGMDPQLRVSLEEQILALLSHSRPLSAREVKERIGHEEDKNRDAWGWNWSAVKRALEGLFERGIVGAASRNDHFERRYTVVNKVLPPGQRLEASNGTPSLPDKESAMLRLTEAAIAAHGIGSLKCIADYFRLPAKETAGALEVLTQSGVVEKVEVAGWDGLKYLHTAATAPRQARGRALLSPFDSLVFERRRLEQLFGFHYRLEIYTPEEKRKYGYYVLPFLLHETLVARVDLKADRQGGRLLVRGAFAEACAPAETADELAAELALMAGWLGLGDVVVNPRGDLAGPLAVALKKL